MTVLTVLLSPVLGSITLRANSVPAAAIFHGTFNATAGLALLVITGGSDLIGGVTGRTRIGREALVTRGKEDVPDSPGLHAA
jgi:hypothetical protein